VKPKERVPMTIHRRPFLIALLLAPSFACTKGFAELTVSSTSPAPNASNVSPASRIAVHFDQPVLVASFTPRDFSAFGKVSGPLRGALSFSNGNQTVTLTPARGFQAGETVMVILSENLRAADSIALRATGYSYTFTVGARPASRTFSEIASMSNRTNPGTSTRIYGANAVDLNQDGWPDLTTVNEDSADLRVFLNRADGSGLYDPFLRPPFPISLEASPNDAGDFDRDGSADIAVAAVETDSLWVVFGRGDGTFRSAQEIRIGDEPHGVAALDADGDGDLDIAVSCCGENRVALVVNNGSGVFGAPVYIESGGDCEYGLTAADMNNDQVLDLVVGTRDSREVIVLRGNGDATFTRIGRQSSGGATWVVGAGDLNGDGDMDVSAANSSSATGSILLGNGAGGLSPPVTLPATGSCVSTDLGDLDGDGDLDCVLSSFGGGVWRLFTNDGAGDFAFDQEFRATSNPSCAIIADLDHDGDLDLALTDEIADEVVLMRNIGAPQKVPAAAPIGLGVLAVVVVLGGYGVLRRRTAAPARRG
jgi:hypothetical protein